jgi:hypothetical protein
MKKLLQVIKNLLKDNRMSREEKWLSESVDLVDLERRQQELMYNKTRGVFR